METPFNNREERGRLVFRFLFVFFAWHLLPLSPGFWRQLFSEGDFALKLFLTANYYPSFFGSAAYYSRIDFFISIGVGLTGAVIWSFINREIDYSRLDDWVRIILRYKLAAVLISYGVLKLFSLQFPGPTISDLNTHYGDMSRARIFELTMGVAGASYQQALGFLEITAALLLLWRRSEAVGALLAFGSLLNVLLAAFAYKTGDEFYSLFLLVTSVFIFWPALPGMWSLLMERPAVPEARHSYSEGPPTLRLTLKAGFAFFSLLYILLLSLSPERAGIIPTEAGLKDAVGFYDVSAFNLNGQDLPYSATNARRWQNAVFENWSTLSIRTPEGGKPKSSPQTFGSAASLKNWETSGNGGRRFYKYQVKDGSLLLQGEGEISLKLSYNRPDSATVILAGIIENGDSVRAVLKKVDKKYLQKIGRRKPVSL